MSEKYAKNIGTTERIISVGLGVYMLYTALNHIRRPPIATLATSGYLLFRGSTGYCPLSRWMGKKEPHNPAINIQTFVTVNRPRAVVYQYWRRLGNLPTFMSHLIKVEELDEKRSHWLAKMPGTGGTIEWDAEIVKDEPDYLIGWSSVSGSPIENAGKVQLYDTPDGLGTEVRVVFSYHPRVGSLGTGIAKLLTPFFKDVIEEEIRSFKRVVEADVVSVAEKQRPLSH
ncbi:SRPBCC family protein [Parapedobacter sp. DT-150]|uniref:SRPBCC family protein n=1 Tax=Parapedobacter sp. DT-150 TaxID=3396162 RepID=UPI003F1BF101